MILASFKNVNGSIKSVVKQCSVTGRLSLKLISGSDILIKISVFVRDNQYCLCSSFKE